MIFEQENIYHLEAPNYVESPIFVQKLDFDTSHFLVWKIVGSNPNVSLFWQK